MSGAEEQQKTALLTEGQPQDWSHTYLGMSYFLWVHSAWCHFPSFHRVLTTQLKNRTLMPESQESWHGRREIQINTSYKKSLGVLIVNYKYQNGLFWFLFFIFLVLPTEKPRNNDQPRSDEHVQHPDFGTEIPFATKITRPHGEQTDSTLGQEISKMSLEYFGKPQIKEGLCQKNLRANLKTLQIPKDWTICTSVKITPAIDRIILNKFKFISSR